MQTPKLYKVVLLSLCLAALGATTAHAGPATPDFGPFVDEGLYYEGQTKCSPSPKPGVVAFQSLVMEAYPDTGAGSISRDCSVGGTSEHKEGRAWDWGVNVGLPSEKAAAEDLLAWLATTDAYGNSSAMGQRLGVMYAIWNRRIWFPWSGWRVYCVQRNGACRDPEDGSVRHPHTDHVHFSFTWRGANKRTTFWKPVTSFAAGAARSGSDGMWVAGGNGGIRILGSGDYYGSKASKLRNTRMVAIASRPSGDGYWMLTRRGRVFGFGGARNLGYLTDMRGADVASTPSGEGYWVLGPGGRVAAFGDAVDLGSVPITDAPVTALAPTPSGAGYWVLTAAGKVHAFGDARHFGDASFDGVVDIAGSATGSGYWIAAASGQVSANGDAPALVQPLDPPASPVVELVPTSTGDGYWLVTAKAVAHAAGDAPPADTAYSGMSSNSFDVTEALGLISE